MGQSASQQEQVQEGDTSELRLYQVPFTKQHWPIVYSQDYNISFAGLEKIHPFDSAKWGKIFKQLKEEKMILEANTVQPIEPSNDELMLVHTREYIDSLSWSSNVAAITEVPPVAFLPNFVVQSRLLSKFRKQTGGTIVAAKLAKERGWAINLGGGFHHCSASQGGGFCAYADITLCIKYARLNLEGIKKVMIVDFDAHQGNGHERDFTGDDDVFVLDMYNRWIYPGDSEAKEGIRCKLELGMHTADTEYLEKIRHNLPRELEEFRPDLVVYNAGTDILIGDQLGQLDITPEGVKQRDELVFTFVRERNIPIVMVTSGGYQRNNAEVIARSILNLNEKKLIPGPNVIPEDTNSGSYLSGVAGEMEPEPQDDDEQ
nr:histone deacetylase 11 [Halisarca dujardinii]QSX72316.1 histone deacetylase 11 isoform 2 [Halisarca dujardinii]